MWLRHCIVISFLVYVAFAKQSFKVLDTGTFSEYYLKDNETFQPVEFVVEPEDYFPKCCPPGFSYGTKQHNCIESDPAKFELIRNVDIVKTAVSNCEVIIDHLILPSDLKFNNDTKVISFPKKQIDFGGYCVDYAHGTNLKYIVRECRKEDYCLSKQPHDMCIKKCCPDGYQYFRKKCTRNPRFGIDLDQHKGIIGNYNGSFAVFYQNLTCQKYWWIENQGLTIAPDGYIYTNQTSQENSIDQEMYCVDGNMLPNGDSSILLVLVCPQTDIEIKFKISRVILLISCICLLFTVIIFVVLSKIRTLMGKIVTVYCSTMFCAFLLLLTLLFEANVHFICKGIAYTMVFLFTATFAWMNVMCYEIWKTLGMVKSGIPTKQQRKIFLKYNAYAWGIPIALVFLIGLFNLFKVLPHKLHPFIGETHCMLEHRLHQNMYGHTVFLVVPQAIMLTINVILFICVLRYFRKNKNKIIRTNESEQSRKRERKMQKYDVQRFITVMKLFFIMGLSWIFEAISGVIDFKQHPTWAVVEIVFDTFNCLQGVLIFWVFVLNKKTLKRLYTKCASNKKVENEAKLSSATSSMPNVDQEEMTTQQS